jgi:hypothetical protein
MVKPNREYKDSVFKNLFASSKRMALKLYNVLTDSRFTLHDGLFFTTLDNVLCMYRTQSDLIES